MPVRNDLVGYQRRFLDSYRPNDTYTNRFELLRDVFVHAYERSCARYGLIRSALGEPDPFRMQYRYQLRPSEFTAWSQAKAQEHSAD